MLRRAASAIAWGVGALLLATLLAAVFRVDSIGPAVEIAMVVLGIVACVSPSTALLLVAAALPIATFTISRFANGLFAWPEALAVAALAGSCVHALTPAGRTRSLHPALAVPAIIFGALTLASMAVSLAVLRLRLGPIFTGVLLDYLTR